MKKIVKNCSSSKVSMLWTDEGFKNVVDTRLFNKRVEEIKNLSKFKIGSGRVYRIDKDSFDESVYDMNKSSLGTRLYTGSPYRDFIKTDHYISIWQKNILFIYNSQKEADKDKANRESLGKEISYKIRDTEYPHLYEIEAININMREDQRTTFYLYANDIVKVWLWFENQEVYYYSDFIDYDFRTMFEDTKYIDIKKECL